jgi:RHS repeat-associated protein
MNFLQKTIFLLLILVFVFSPLSSAFADDNLVATISGSGASAIVRTVATDHLTGSNIITNSAGAVEELADYYPYGDIRLDEKSGSFSEQRKFAGHEYDADTGLSYMNARYYDGKVGRFASQDPAFLAVGDRARLKAITGMDLQKYLSDPQGFNSYAYARNNPLKIIDSDGQWFKEVIMGQQSWSSFSQEVGQATQYMGSGWQTAMDHPYLAGGAVGVAGGLAVAGGAAGLSAISNAYLQGAGTACLMGCGQVADKGVKYSQQAMEFLNKGPVNTDVYLGVRGGIDKYVGIAKDMTSRAYQHGDRFDMLRRITKDGQLTRGQAHSLEQTLINKNPGFENKINSISPNQSYYKEAVKWGENWLKGNGH